MRDNDIEVEVIDMNEKDLALNPVDINFNPDETFNKENRQWQGIPTIERTEKGRMFVSFYSGGETEGPDNYVLLIKSDDTKTWTKPILVVNPPGKVRAFDPCLWIDPQKRLWLFWSQSYEYFDGRAGVWAIVCDNTDDEILSWTKPVRIANGVMMNKPTVLKTGEWLLPCAVWGYNKPDGTKVRFEHNYLPDEMFSNVICSVDNGKSFSLIGHADVPNRGFDEHMFIEKSDSSIWMLVRAQGGIGESVSFDGGKTWSVGKSPVILGPNSRFFIRRLNSGNLLLVNHLNFTGRNNLSAQISMDDGQTWIGNLMLDERDNVSYPDGTIALDGTIYIIYDRGRNKEKDILLAKFTEEDILAGRCVNKNSVLKITAKEG